MKHLPYILILFFSTACSLPEQPPSDKKDEIAAAQDTSWQAELTKFIVVQQDSSLIPGYATAIFSKDSTLYETGIGYANLEQEIPYSTLKVQMIASISKSIVGMALMKAQEMGKLNLDDPIGQHLPFPFKHPQGVVTLRQLASHTGSISDPESYSQAYVFQQALDPSVFPDEWHDLLNGYQNNHLEPLDEFLASLFDEKSSRYEPSIYASSEPGTEYDYSNIGANLLALAVETAVEQPFDSFTEEQIFSPLGMKNTGWHLKDVADLEHCTYYLENLKPIPQYELSTYPDGGLFTSVHDLIKFLQEVMKGSIGEGSLLTAESYQEMISIQGHEEDASDGVLWDLEHECCFGHSGNDFGTATLMYVEKETGIGRILFTNVSLEKEEQEEAFYTVWNGLFGYPG
ncbi:MAG: serine hydrolase domain-containing protein [Flavobacteriales bacterium]